MNETLCLLLLELKPLPRAYIKVGFKYIINNYGGGAVPFIHKAE